MFKYKSKLSETKYPCLKTMEEILQWLVFAKSVDPYEIDPVFLGRLGAMAKYEGRKHVIISGHRPTSLQEKLYLNAGGVKNSDGTYSDPKGKVKGRVAKPKTSYHEFRIAVDSGDKYYRALNKNEPTSQQTNWIKFGLYKPLTIGNGIKPESSEDWHLQPIELLGVSRKDRHKWQPKLIIESPLEILASKNIISPINLNDWDKWLKDDYINANLIHNLLDNYYFVTNKKRGNIDDIINFALERKIITNKDYWQNKMPKNSEYVKLMIQRIVDK